MTAHRSARFWQPVLALLIMMGAAHGSEDSETNNSEEPPAVVDDTQTVWKDSIQDVYLDGELHRDRLTFMAREPGRLLLLEPNLSSGWIVDLESNAVAQASGVQLSVDEDRIVAAVGDTTLDSSSSAADLGEDYLWLKTSTGTFVIGAHQGLAEEMDAATLFSVAPGWKRLYDAYTPDETVVARLHEIESPTELTLAFGTWCGDSRREVPKVLKTLDLAGNPNLNLKLVSLGRGFLEPAAFIRESQLTNVPTLVVKKGEREWGRLVERPRGQDFPKDLTAMLAGTPNPATPPADSLLEIARGRYRVLSKNGEELGTESFTVSALRSGGREYRSTRDDSDGTTVVRQRVDPEGVTQFIEITRQGVAHSRTRVSARNGSLSLLTRGERTGIVRQSLTPAPGTALISPNWTGRFLHWIEAGRSDAPMETPALVLGGSSRSPAATPAAMRFRADPITEREVEGVVRPVAQLLVYSGSERTLVEVDAEWGLPYAASLSDGTRLELMTFTAALVEESQAEEKVAP